MKKLLLISTLSLLIFACQNEEDQNKEFDTFKNSFIENMWEIYPDWASSVGYHKFDSVLIVPNQVAMNKELSFASENLKKLADFDLEKLSANNKTDYHMIENQLKSVAWRLKEEKSHEWNPSGYNISGSFAVMLSNDYDKLDVRLHNFGLKLTNVPAYYEAAKQNIKNPTQVHKELAIAQNLGGISVFESELDLALSKSNLKQSEKELIKNRAKKAVLAIKDYADWLQKTPFKSHRDFRLGQNLYAQKFEYDIQSEYDYNQVFDKAMKRKEFLHQKMTELATKLWPKYFGMAQKPTDKLSLIKQVIDKISLTHADVNSFQNTIQQQIPELVKFVEAKNLLYLDPKKPLIVRKEPDYMAGVAGASITAPGPYDKKGNTYYNVGSLAAYTPEDAESFLREYNQYTLQILNIHEAIPGHYAQLVYSNQSPSMIKSIFGNGAMVEGWAVYTELMMLENGYGNNQDELWLMYYKWNLRTVCNTILDISVHTKGMTEKSALNLLMNEAFQQEAEAKGKWKRVTLSSVQLCSYFTGFTEICDLRTQLQKKQGKQFKLKSFHEKFLSYGSAPVKYIKDLMLEENKK